MHVQALQVKSYPESMEKIKLKIKILQESLDYMDSLNIKVS